MGLKRVVPVERREHAQHQQARCGAGLSVSPGWAYQVPLIPVSCGSLCNSQNSGEGPQKWVDPDDGGDTISLRVGSLWRVDLNLWTIEGERVSNKKLRVHNTDIDNLTSNLRGEVGEIVSAWVMMRSFMAQAAASRTTDLQKDFENPQLVMLNALTDKLKDEIVARLAELAERKVGRLTFYFAQLKLNQLEEEVAEFNRFIEKNRFQEKRNYDISHKEMPESWTAHKLIHIPYEMIVQGVVMALRLMKRIDTFHLGPRAKYLWREMRQRRYKLVHPAKVGYMLLPYFWLSADDRMAIIREEMAEGRSVWRDMPIKINGKDTSIKACGEFGAIILGGRIVLLDESFLELTAIDFPSESGESVNVQIGSSE